MSTQRETEQGRLCKRSFSFFEETLQQLAALAQQRPLEKESDLQRQALHIGTLFLTMSIGKVDPHIHQVGCWQEKEVARELRQWIVLATDWLEQHGYAAPSASSPSPAALAALLGTLAQTTGQQGSIPATTNNRGLGSMVTAIPSQRKQPEPAFLSERALANLGLEETGLV